MNDEVKSWLDEFHLPFPDVVPEDWVAYCRNRMFDDPGYAMVAGRALTHDIKSECAPTFAEVRYVNLSVEVEYVRAHHKDIIENIMLTGPKFDRDFFSVATLQRSYLLKDTDGNIVETPEYMYMRVAIGIHGHDLDAVHNVYCGLVGADFTFATPTLFNAGTKCPQMSSCFLLAMKDDSIEGIFNTLHDCAEISKYAGGIGLHISNVRGTDAYIGGTNGNSNGIVPMLRCFNETARYVDQGGGKRKGSFAIYLEPWHWDVCSFLELKRPHGSDDLRTRDLFLALWVSDLFMQRVADDAQWTLFCPKDVPDLIDLHSHEFRMRYEYYEDDAEKLGIRYKTIKARDVWTMIKASMTESGVPYLLAKDACNSKSNQQNLGTIKSSNLCVEIIEYSSPSETAVCNLASVCLPRFVNAETHFFDLVSLGDTVQMLVRSMDLIIDKNRYPTCEAHLSNTRHRPIGIGVQGLADVFAMLEFPYESLEAHRLNAEIFETIYFNAVSASVLLAKDRGPYSSFEGSPASQGQLQFDLWNVKPSVYPAAKWMHLKDRVQSIGLRNSLLTAVMPTASTAQICMNSEQVEPLNSNLSVRNTLAGSFMIVNKHLVKKLKSVGMWNDTVKAELIANRGSIQGIEGIDTKTKNIFKTIWEIKMKHLVDMAVGRAPFICQSQSMSLYFDNVTDRKLDSALFYAWRNGLKTLSYYIRSKPAGVAQAVAPPCESCSA